MAAVDGEKLRQVIAASPTSLEAAVAVANKVRPKDLKVEELRDEGH